MSHGSGGGYGAAPQQIIYVPAPQPVMIYSPPPLHRPPAPRPVPARAPSYGGRGYGGSHGPSAGGHSSGQIGGQGGYGGFSGCSPVHIHVHSAPAQSHTQHQPIATSPCGGGNGDNSQAGGYRGFAAGHHAPTPMADGLSPASPGCPIPSPADSSVFFRTFWRICSSYSAIVPTIGCISFSLLLWRSSSVCWRLLELPVFSTNN